MTDQVVAENVIGISSVLFKSTDSIFKMKVAFFLKYLILKHSADFEDFSVGTGFEIQRQ